MILGDHAPSEPSLRTMGRRDLARLGVATSLLLSCDSFAFQRRIARIGEALRGKGAERVVRGRLRSAGATDSGELIAITGDQSIHCSRPPGGCIPTYDVDALLQRPAAIAGEGLTAIAAPLSWIWLTTPDSITSVALGRARRVDESGQLAGKRLWSFSEGDSIAVFGTVEDRDGASGFYADAEILVGDLERFEQEG